VDAMRISGARWAWVLAVTFLVATVIALLANLNITAPAPEFAEDAALPDIIFAEFAASRGGAQLQEVGNSLLYAAGFLAIAMLGPILREVLGRGDARVTRFTVFFLVAGTIGILSQVMYIGGKDVATAPYYCDCDYLDAQLISRVTALDVLGGIQAWMVDAFIFLFAVGVLAAADVASTKGWPGGFVRASQVLAVLGLAAVVWDRIAVPLLVNADVHIEYGLIGLGILAVIAGVATPVWAVILARTLSRPEGDAAAG
jgi:hypothetical protein